MNEIEARDRAAKAEISIIPKWGDIFDSARGDDIPSDLIGATIERIGAPEDGQQIEGGGLAIEYIPAKSTEKKLLLLAFNELGMWMEYLKTTRNAT